MEKTDTKDKMVKSYTEKFQIPLAAALFLLCIEMFICERKKGRIKE